MGGNPIELSVRLTLSAIRAFERYRGWGGWLQLAIDELAQHPEPEGETIFVAPVGYQGCLLKRFRGFWIVYRIDGRALTVVAIGLGQALHSVRLTDQAASKITYYRGWEDWFRSAIQALAEDPNPDGSTKLPAPAETPYVGCLLSIQVPYWIVYQCNQDDPNVIIVAVLQAPELRRPGPIGPPPTRRTRVFNRIREFARRGRADRPSELAAAQGLPSRSLRSRTT